MALISMTIFDTEENQRTDYTRQTLSCIFDTVDFGKHNLIVVDNASCERTKRALTIFQSGNEDFMQVITLPENIGTARGINVAWKHRKPNQHLIKMDNDCVVHSSGWVEQMEQAIICDPSIGILGLKRKDLMENPFREIGDPYRSELRIIKNKGIGKFFLVEDVAHVMGTCQMYNHRLIDKIGGMMQPGIYGFDDTLAAVRCKIAGFKNSFLPHIEIDHIDDGQNPYTQEKHKLAMADMAEFNRIKESMFAGTHPIFVQI